MKTRHQSAIGVFIIVLLFGVKQASAAVPPILLHVFFNPATNVAVSGDTVVVSAATQTHVYDLTSSTPAEPLITLNTGGGAVALAGTLLVVGVPSENAGTTHVYDLASAAPTEPIIVLTNPATAGL